MGSFLRGTRLRASTHAGGTVGSAAPPAGSLSAYVPAAMRLPAIALRAAALLASLSASAAFRPDHGPRDFNKIDVDGDGLLSSAELEAHTTERLTAEIEGFMGFFDANGDGEVTETEYGAKAGEFFTTDRRTADWFWKSLFKANEDSDG